MTNEELKAISKPRRRLIGSYKDLIRSILAMREAKDGKIVYPGKGLTGREIRARVLNKSYLPSVNGLSYSEEKGVADVLRMSRIELLRSHVNEKPVIEKMKADLDKKFADVKKKHQEEAIAKRIKDATDGKG